MSAYDRWLENLPYPLKILIFIMSSIDKFFSKNNLLQNFLFFFLYHYDYILLVIVIAAISIIIYDIKYRGSLRIDDYLLEAIEGIKENKIRSFFSIFGLSIGIASVIGILSLGQSTGGLTYYENSNNKDISYIFSLYSGTTGTAHFLKGVSFTAGDLIDIKNKCPSVEKLVPFINRGKVKITFNHEIAEASLIGTSGEYELPHSLISGRFFTTEDMENRNRVCLITSDRLKEELFEDMDPLDKYININGNKFRVIGVISDLDYKWSVFIPFSLIINDSGENVIFIIKTYRGINPSETREEISHVIKTKYNRRPFTLAQKMTFFGAASNSIETFEKELQSSVSLTPIRAIMGVIAFISLIIGGIGIMNIMLVSVTQRTREIGVRLAMGARKSDILSQFLLESVFLSIIGGIIGIILGIFGTMAIVKILNSFGFPLIFKLSYFSIRNNLLLSLLFSMAVGVLFGEYPARKAAAMDPIDCLRHS
jgi:putative ABC transport system permease protein